MTPHATTTIITAAALALGVAGTAHADLTITEIWSGGNATTSSDWFELTNVGPSAVNLSGYYYDDESADPTENAALTGVSSLAAGESAIFLVSWHDDYASSSAAINAFASYWNTAGAYQIGYIFDGSGEGGAGLGGGGDFVNVFDGNTSGANLIDFKGYDDGIDGQTWVWNPVTESDTLQLAETGVFGGHQSNGSVVGSPGVIPEPASLALLALGGVAMLSRRRSPDASGLSARRRQGDRA